MQKEKLITLLEKFYTADPKWYELVGNIHAVLERVKISEEQSADVFHLRKLSRILSIYASTAIEGNRLTVGQVTDVINGKPVWGPPKDIKEVQNAWLAYNQMETYNPWSVHDLLSAHATLTEALVDESGQFRTVDVAVVRSDGVVLHRGSPAKDTPKLVVQLLEWGQERAAHPLIVSSVIHYMLEYIHPFCDGNGRIGRLWQSLILCKWNPLFAWMPIETLVYNNQAHYYKSLQDSHKNGQDCRPFITFMLGAIENSLYKYIDVATETKWETKDLPADRVQEHVLLNVPQNVPQNKISGQILLLLQGNPELTAIQLGQALSVSDRTIKRHIQKLREQGWIRRVGSDKTGYWEVLRGQYK